MSKKKSTMGSRHCCKCLFLNRIFFIPIFYSRSGRFINISYVPVYRSYQQELNVSVVNQEYRFHRQGLYNNIHTRVISSAFSGGLSIPIIFRCSQGDTIHHVMIPNRSSAPPPQQIWKNLKA